ncbi:MAG: PorP/SprF family type IX secretion system membrane protein [Bacteroidia bacterium]|nr:PorP/SprF family type IX secretion system membrane protein [Bacteroidia bacterium]
MKTKANHPMIIILGLFLMISGTQGQDPNYSQWLSAPLYYNPAFTGLNNGIRARLSYRDQWPNLPVDFHTLYFSADLGDRRLPGSGGIGLTVNRDNEGIGFIRNLSAGLSLSVRIPITSNMICQVGIKAAIVQKWIHWNEFVFSDQLNEKYGNIYTTAVKPPDNYQRLFPDFAVGGLLKFVTPSGKISGTAGFAADHLFQPDESIYALSKSPLPRKYVGHLDFVLSLGRGPSSSQNPVLGFGDALLINPGIIYQHQNGMNSLQVGVNLLKFNIYTGGYFKFSSAHGSSTALMLLAGYRFNMTGTLSLKFMYSYDLQVSGNLQGSGGAHEISLILEFQNSRIFNKNKVEECIIVEDNRPKLSALECSSF